MLFSIESSVPKRITRIPHEAEFYLPRRQRLSSAQFDAMDDSLFEKIDPDAQEVYTSSWIPGSDWRGSRFSQFSKWLVA
jgi:hypothetical protein